MTVAHTPELQLGDTTILSVADGDLFGNEKKNPSLTGDTRSKSTIVELNSMDLVDDPLVALLNRADGISSEAFALFLQRAVSLQSRRMSQPQT